ncbi:MAG: flagellar biosynthesis protein FliQ [Bdellovibrionales bacterium]|nr:flagellar biosynthesis protein FliQ [Bdellovibrionales bacterium]
MSEELVLKLGQETLKTTAMLASPLLISALVVGLVVSVFQAVTQINEATLTFIPKMIVVGLVLVLAAPWMMDVMNHFTVQLFENLGDMVRIR